MPLPRTPLRPHGRRTGRGAVALSGPSRRPAAASDVAPRWGILAASTLAQAASAVMVHGPAFLIVALQTRNGLTLAQAGLVAATPTLGVMSTLVAWGALTDRFGERRVLLTGLGLTVAAGALAAWAATSLDSLAPVGVALFAAGAAAASVNTASGRVVVGWFPPWRRGLAMGIRQMGQPVGVGVAAVSMAVVADRFGVGAALWVPTAACAGAAVLVAAVVRDPPRPARAATPDDNPYRHDRFLVRVHGVSVLLVVPQFVVWTFALVWLVDERGLSPGAAGSVVGVAQIAGAVGRIAVGQASDMVGSRMRPLRHVSAAAGLTMLLLGLTAGLGWALAVPLVMVATVVTVADNGLAFTAVAERAGPFWSGRALGVQNTGQFAAAATVAPLAGALIAAVGYGAAFALTAVFPLAALALVPARSEDRSAPPDLSVRSSR